MHAAADNPQFYPPYERRQPQPVLGTAASIWAPQPQPSDMTWPRTLDTFSRVAEREVERQARSQPLVRREDVFGPEPSRSKDVGAIGDGRKKISPGFDDSHVEQLLRTLNLNSPAPFVKKPVLNLDTSPSSPDFSPASVTSSLLQTPTDLSPSRSTFDSKLYSPYELTHSLPYLPQSQSQPSLLFDHSNSPPSRNQESFISHSPSYSNRPSYSSQPTFIANQQSGAFEPFSSVESQSGYHTNPQHASATHGMPRPLYNSPPQAQVSRRVDHTRQLPLPPIGMDWRLAQAHGQYHQQLPPAPPSTQSDWVLSEELGSLKSDYGKHEYITGAVCSEEPLRGSYVFQQQAPQTTSHEPINFLSLLHPSSSPPYHIFVERIIKSSDQQASIFLQQKLKVADLEERAKIVDAICAKGFEMMAHRFGNWAVQRCLEAASVADERRKIVSCMRGRVVELAMNCYGCHVLQKALDCEEDIRLLIVSELLLGDPAQTLVNKHASHVWSKIMELAWTPPAPPIFAYVNKSLKGKWASLACHETGSLVVQHAFENLEADAKDGIVDELLGHGAAVFADVAKNQWGAYCIQHILEHGSEKHRRMTLGHLLDGLLEFATNEQGAKSVTKALKEGGKETLDKVVERMCESAKGSRRAMIVDLALSVTGSQLIASVLPTADKDQRALLYDCIRGHIVTLRGCKTGSKVIWLFDRMRAYYGY